MKSKIIQILKYLFLLFVGIALLWLTFRNEDFDEIWAKISVANPYWLGASIVIAIFAFISRAVRWIMLMEPLGYKPKLSNTLYALFLGYFANLAIPRIGEITRCGTLTRIEKVPFNSLIGTVIVERVIDLIMLFLTMMLVGVLEFDLLSSFISDKVITPLIGNTSIFESYYFYGFILVCLLGLFIIIKWLKSEKEGVFKNKILGILREVGSGLKSILRMKKNGWFIFHTIFIWVLYFLMTWVCFFCLESTSHLDMKAGIFILVVGGLGMSAPVQGGIGAYHYIVSQGLQLFDVSSTDGIVYATLVHTTQTLLVVVLGLFALMMLFFVRKSNRENNTHGQEINHSGKDH